MPKKIYLLIFISFLLPTLLLLLRQQTKLQNFAATSDQTILLNFTKPIYQFSLSGRVDLYHQDLSFLRIILVDNQQNEYLVYETSPLLADQKSFFIANQCDETCLLDGIIPKQLRIEGYQYSFLLANYSASSNLPKTIQSISLQSQQIKKEKDSLKISQLNKQIKQKQLSWTAGETSVSKLTYAQKKKLFSTPDGKPIDKLPNLQGFEYYKGGIFNLKTGETNPTPPISSNLPVSWDWRNVHGQNWNTPVKNQGSAGTCWAHANLGALESQINLFFNQHLNIDLSEQMFVDCAYDHQLPLGMAPDIYPACGGNRDNYGNFFYQNCWGYNQCVISQHGIADEACDPYNDERANNANSATCNLENVCVDWQSRIWKSNDFHDYKLFEDNSMPLCTKQTMVANEDELKKILIQKGPLDARINSWGHAMVLVGYDHQSDWKMVDYCEEPNYDMNNYVYNHGELCDPISGCIPRICTNPGETKNICYNLFFRNNTGWISSFTYTYKCIKEEGDNGHYLWKFDHEEYCQGRCINNECIPNGTLNITEGYRTCGSININEKIFFELSEYRQGAGETYWIFKNSWGADWGENGYGKIAVSLTNLSVATLPLGPFTPPSDQSFWPPGFDGQIKCFDNDRDGYCNWGISETKPSTCPFFCKPQKDCDDSNPTIGLFDNNLNCLAITPTPIRSPKPPRNLPTLPPGGVWR